MNGVFMLRVEKFGFHFTIEVAFDNLNAVERKLVTTFIVNDIGLVSLNDS